MNRSEIALLEKACTAELDSAFTNYPPELQTRSKRAIELVERGYLQHSETRLPGHPPVVVRGYTLTELGRMTYCQWVAENSQNEDL